MTEHTITEVLKMAVQAHKSGDVETADKYYTAILKAQPNHSDANHNMGVLAIGLENANSHFHSSKRLLTQIQKLSNSGSRSSTILLT